MRSPWAHLIHKVYEVDPLECPKCKGSMRVIALIDDKAVPPKPDAQVLTYHPVSGIA